MVVTLVTLSCCIAIYGLSFYLVDMDGFVKVLSDKKTDRMLGAHIIGSVSGTCNR